MKIRIFFFFISVKVRCFIVAGGLGDLMYPKAEIITYFGKRQLPPLLDWEGMVGAQMAVHDGEILLFPEFLDDEMSDHRSESKLKCFKFNKDFSKDRVHSVCLAKEDALGSSFVTTANATYIFGGHNDPTRYEYLPIGSTTWHEGKNQIPGGFEFGCAIAIKSDQEILLVGGRNTRSRMLRFNTTDHTFEELPARLKTGRWGGVSCAVIPGTNKVIITGGGGKSTEIFNTEEGSISMGNPMNFARIGHGIGTITMNDEDRLVVFGGVCNNRFEVYNPQNSQWEMTDITLNESMNNNFIYLNLRLGDILPKL